MSYTSETSTIVLPPLLSRKYCALFNSSLFNFVLESTVLIRVRSLPQRPSRTFSKAAKVQCLLGSPGPGDLYRFNF
ncbi:hypothetical protein SFRURICE_000314 [Spodoptera frugiperda]|nr:hypothetical protein SFRURICE_000314 [Spodoptera frugiperda]